MIDSKYIHALNRGVHLSGGMAWPLIERNPFPWEVGPPVPIGGSEEITRKCGVCSHEYATDLLCPWPCPECGQEQWPAPHDQRKAIEYYYGYSDGDTLTIDVLRLHRGWTWGLAFGHTNTGRPKFLMLRGDAYESEDGATRAAFAAEPVLRDWRTWIKHGSIGVGGWRLEVMPLGEGRRHRWFLHRGESPLCMGPVGWDKDEAWFTAITLRHALEKRNGVIEAGVRLAPCFDSAAIERRRLEREAWIADEAERLARLREADAGSGSLTATWDCAVHGGNLMGCSLDLCELCVRFLRSSDRFWLTKWRPITRPLKHIPCRFCEARRTMTAELRHNQTEKETIECLPQPN